MKAIELIDKTVTIVAVLSIENWLEQLIIINTNIDNCGYEAFDVVLLGIELDIDANKYLHPKAKVSSQFSRDMATGQIVNQFIPNFCTDYLVIMTPNSYLPDNWLQTALFEFSQFDSLKLFVFQNTTNYYCHCFLDKNDNLVERHVPSRTDEPGTIVLPRQTVFMLGAFNENLYSAYWIADYMDRISNMGYAYMCSNQRSIEIALAKFDAYYQSTYEDFCLKKSTKNHIPFQFSNESLKCPESIANDFATQNTMELINYMPNLGIIFRSPALSHEQIVSIANFAQMHELKWSIQSSVNNVIVVFTC